MFNPKIIDNFLSKEDYEYLVEFAKSTDLWQKLPNDSWWNERVIHIDTLRENDNRAANILNDAINQTKLVIEREYNLTQEIFPDVMSLIRWFPGMSQPPHADDMTNTDIKGFEARKFGTIIYLNNDYTGGHTFYPQYDFEVVPVPGRLAIHPGDPDHLHGVTTIEGNVRYTIAAFWRFERTDVRGFILK